MLTAQARAALRQAGPAMTKASLVYIGITLIIILLLHFNLKRREALRQKRLDDMAASRDVSTAKGTGSDAQA